MSASATVAIVVNGEDKLIVPGLTLAGVLAWLERQPRWVAIEHNGAIVPRSRFATTRVSEGDRLEIVQFVQGGSAWSTNSSG